MEDVFIKRWSENSGELTIMLYATKYFGHKDRFDLPPGVDEGVAAFMRTLGVTADDEHRQKLKKMVRYIKRQKVSVFSAICKYFVPEMLYKEGFYKEAVSLRYDAADKVSIHQILSTFNEQLHLLRGCSRWLSATNTLTIASHPQLPALRSNLLSVTALSELMDHDRPDEWKDALKALEVCLGLRTRYPSVFNENCRFLG